MSVFPALPDGGGMVAGRGSVGPVRWASTKAVEGEGGLQQTSLFQRFWRWLHDLDDLERWDNPVSSGVIYTKSLCVCVCLQKDGSYSAVN